MESLTTQRAYQDGPDLLLVPVLVHHRHLQARSHLIGYFDSRDMICCQTFRDSVMGTKFKKKKEK